MYEDRANSHSLDIQATMLCYSICGFHPRTYRKLRSKSTNQILVSHKYNTRGVDLRHMERYGGLGTRVYNI